MAKRKSKSKPKDTLATILAIGFLGLLIFFIIRSQKKEIEFVTFTEFGIDIPVNYEIHGIDVSKYQKDIAWSAVKSMNVKGIQLGFVFIKATEGVTITDPKFSINWEKAKKNEIPRGAYHFFRTNKDSETQAKLFIKTVQLEKNDLPPVLDVETIDKKHADDLKSNIKTWLDIVEAHYGVKPIIYTNADFYNKYLGADFDQYPLWVAHYFEKKRPNINRSWHFWQHNDGGNVNGINAKVDFNVFNGDSSDFKKLLIP